MLSRCSLGAVLVLAWCCPGARLVPCWCRRGAAPVFAWCCFGGDLVLPWCCYGAGLCSSEMAARRGETLGTDHFFRHFLFRCRLGRARRCELIRDARSVTKLYARHNKVYYTDAADEDIGNAYKRSTALRVYVTLDRYTRQAVAPGDLGCDNLPPKVMIFRKLSCFIHLTSFV